MKPYSYSKIKLFEERPYAFYLHYIKGVEGQPTEAMEQGKRRHKYFEDMLTKGEAEGDFEDVMAWERVKPYVEGYTAEVKLAIDEEGNGVDFDSNEAWFRGILDATYGGSFVDYKTGQSIYCDEFQLETQAMMFSFIWEVSSEVVGSFIFPYIQSATAKSFIYEKEDITEIFETLKHNINTIETNIEEYNKSGWSICSDKCDGCIYWTKCEHCNKPVESQGLVVTYPKSLTADTAPKAVEFILQVKQMIANAEKELKAYCKKNGNIETEGGEYGFFEKESRTVPDVKRLVEEVSSKGVEYWDMINISPTNAAKLIKEAGLREEDYISTKVSNSFGEIKGE